MNGKFNESFEEHKDMYVINLDLTRIFWLIALGLFSVTFFFLFGYWLGNDTVDKKSVNYKPFITMNQEDIRNQAIANENDSNNQVSGAVLNQEPLNSQEVRSELARLSQAHRERTTHTANSNQTTSADRTNIDLNLNEANPRSSDLNKPYTIQISIHRVKANAHRLKKKLIENGFNAYIHTKISRRGHELSFVRVGPFANEEEAQRTQHRLRRTVRAAKDCLVVKQ